MVTEQFEVQKPKRSMHVWLWLLALLPVVGFVGFVAVLAPVVLALANVEKSPGYALAVQTVTTHPGVEDLLGAPVSVTETKAKHLTKKESGTILELTLELSGLAAQGIVTVTATEKAGRWLVERAILSDARGEYALLADGSLQQLRASKVLASSP